MNPLKPKYDSLYMDIALRAAKESTSEVIKVGAALVLPSGMVSIGWNGTPAGFDNCCEEGTKVDEVTGQERPATKPEVIHAERNAIDKLTRQGVSTDGSILYVTLAPCFECAKAMSHLGIKQVVFLEPYKSNDGIDHLGRCGIVVRQFQASSTEVRQ
jgi:dCMP deaminase